MFSEDSEEGHEDFCVLARATQQKTYFLLECARTHGEGWVYWELDPGGPASSKADSPFLCGSQAFNFISDFCYLVFQPL